MSHNIVKHGQLQEIAQDLWNKAKARDIEALRYDPATKTITGTNSATNAGNNALSIPVQLTNLVSIDEKAEFKQDVSSDNVAIANNKYMGTNPGYDSDNRSLGFRQLTTSAFVDGYVDHIRIYVDKTNNRPMSAWKVWAITKGANGKESDRVQKVVHQSDSIEVKNIGEGAETKKFVIIPVKSTFAKETYFIVKCDTHKLEVLHNIETKYRPDVVNLNKSQPHDTEGAEIDWTGGLNSDTNTAVMYLYGRESIGSLSLKLNQLQADGSKYVLQSETTNTGGETQYAGRVVKLGDDGKINSTMIPEIAINRVLQADNESTALGLIGEGKDRLQVGDVVVLQDTNKIYIYKGRPTDQNDNDFRRDFLEIAMGNGTVKSVNTVPPGANGNVTVNADNINLSSTDNTNVKAELDKKISNITLHNDKKHLTITKATSATPEQLDLTTAFAADNISYSGQIGGATKNNVKEAIDALKDEANKGIKSIKGGRPNDQGNIDITVAQAGDGITMTFGDGGTAVEIATYMTAAEVNEIKALFR